MSNEFKQYRVTIGGKVQVSTEGNKFVDIEDDEQQEDKG